MKIRHTFGQQLKELRQRVGLTQRELAKRASINFTYISKIENGVLPAPGEKTILKLARALKADADLLLIYAGKIPTHLTSNFGAELKELRQRVGLTQRELAKRASINFTYISKIENGVLPAPGEKTILKLARALKADADLLLIYAGKVPARLVSKEPEEFLRDTKSIYTKLKVKTSSQRILPLPNIEIIKNISSNVKEMVMNRRNQVSENRPRVPVALVLRSNLRIILSVLIVVIIGATLWFAPPAQALTVSISPTSGSGNLGSAYRFTVTINVEDTVDQLPIQAVTLQIYQGNNLIDCTNMPIPTSASSSASKTYNTSGGTVAVTGTSGTNWVYTTNSRFGYGYGYDSWTWETITPSLTTGYGYGYGYDTLYTGSTSLNYAVTWTPSTSWSTGDYTIRTIVYGDSGDASKAVTNDTAAKVRLSAAATGGTATTPIGGAAPDATPEPGVTDVSSVVTTQGTFTADVEATSDDDKVTLNISEGTTGTTAAGDPLSEISITEMTSLPSSVEEPPDGAIVLNYDFGPDGATFDDPVTITFTYDEADIPSGAAEEDMVIVYWDGSAWVELSNITIDPATNTISGEIDHFTLFAVIASVKPASFTISGLAISPTEVDPGQVINISATVANSGNLAGSYVVNLKVNGSVVGSQTIRLEGGESQVVTFTTTGEVGGTYEVIVNDLTGSFTVKAAPAPTPTPPVPTPTPTPAPPAPTPTPAPPTPAPAPVPAPATNWLLLGIIGVVAVIIVGFVLWYAFRTMRRYD
ncbi:helix-turn-helix domain-containing protein [Chloroflexota bacterium]